MQSSSAPTMDRRHVLCVGMCVADIIHVCSEYPVEDSDKRSKHGRWQRGGNASNVCTVLRALQQPADFLGPLSSSTIFQFILADMRDRQIDFSHCPQHQCDAPLSSVLLNEQTGSRTIIHSNPGVPPLTADDFARVPLAQYAWVHFEGRTPDQTLPMMQRIRDWNESVPSRSPADQIIVSLDMEKTNVDYAQMLPLADVAFVGKDLAQHWGCDSRQKAVLKVWQMAGGGLRVICPWGEQGATIMVTEDVVYESPAYPPPSGKVVDSLGAGDTFVAGVICGLLRAPREWKAAVRLGCRVAGHKVGSYGYDCVAELSDRVDEFMAED